jgi:hypothetical protein
VWTETILYKFTGLLDGANPQGPLTILADGTLLGGTPRGGKSGCNFAGCGAIWQLTPPATGTTWQFAILYNFTGGADGGTPIAAPVSHNGLLFGTTQFGGTAGDGVVYTLTPPAAAGGAWTETVLHTFTGAPDGSGPLGQLLFDTAGNAYGTTLVGGDAQCVENPQGVGCGTVFRLAPPATTGGTWNEAQIFVFKGAADGADVDGKLVPGAKGVLFGSTIGNSDTIFGSVSALSPPATGSAYSETTLHAFTAIAGGAEPRGLTSQAGNLFGLTQEGGAYSGGTAFELTP